MKENRLAENNEILHKTLQFERILHYNVENLSYSKIQLSSIRCNEISDDLLPSKQLVEALCIRKISDRLSILVDINRHSHLTSLQLAEDFTDLSSTFDLLFMTSLMKWSGVVFNMIEAVISPANPNEKSFDEILFVLEEHFSPQRSEIAKRTSQLFDKCSTKCRIVFDGSVLFRNNSLNRQLDPGPPLQNDLVQILMRFRRFRVGLQADIS
ncbi:hypothetical protein T09_12514 [Trichinella sp. T9]|nr:hypothetical protein T09_12514 [Trichinella sp. T9]